METKIIKVVFGGRRYAVTNKRTRTDYGQQFEFVDIALPETFEVIFSNSNTSAGTGKKMIGSNQRCLIPDEYLKTGQPIYAWVLVHDGKDDGRHMYSIKSPVDDMPDTSPEEPTPVEQSVISQAIGALNDAVERTSADVETATQKASEASDSATASAQSATASANSAEQSAQRAVESAQSANQSAVSASQSAQSASASAQSATASAESATASATSASQSAQSADRAEQSARTAGYLDVEIVNGRLIYKRTDAVDVDFRLTDGRLIMEAI